MQKIQDYAIIGDKLAPGIGDWYLARKGYESQQYNGLADPDRPHNLYEPVPGRYGAHGDFDHRASMWSFHVWLSRYRTWILLGFIILILILFYITS